MFDIKNEPLSSNLELLNLLNALLMHIVFIFATDSFVLVSNRKNLCLI